MRRNNTAELIRHDFSCEADKYDMAVLARRFAAETLHVVDLPYRLSSWALDDARNASLWFNEKQELIGWAVLQTPFWTIDYVMDPQAVKGLFGEILNWAKERALQARQGEYGHSVWNAMVFTRQAGRIEVLEQAGFKCQKDIGEDSWSKVLMRRSNAEPARRYAAPSGFTIRSLGGEQEVDAYVELHQEVFGTKNMSSPWRDRTLHHPDYRANLDIVVEAPDGRLGAFCICWIGKSVDGELEGHVEPLGCHQDFRRFALGRVALAEGLYRLQKMGAQNIFVETDNFRNTAFRLYESFDFQVIEDVLVYAWELTEE